MCVCFFFLTSDVFSEDKNPKHQFKRCPRRIDVECSIMRNLIALTMEAELGGLFEFFIKQLI